ncbi:ABC transporter ATP-binding protein/permease [Alicyclobacillus fastidiosus]|uniref:ABC transporter ATP-binding protein/permease n=1 Tax=Alicyclobacillus fastidiosus TaxID=392011 RepID=A0ABY6ZBF1_9BACL|nr:ABC transporter ATP-binding protein [Alicyclobacillus fastidiosus]WAH40223.1 ABC transporter ATP-binding protein/permease [Alicyclobacillus fastidiosus]GMA61585.1 multidrug ABC transporter ATP-binding protein [Alicyclobacillus fastidiosus]
MKELLRGLKPYWLSVASVLVLIFLQSLSTVYLPRQMSDIVDIGVVRGDVPYILRVGALMLLVSIAAAACSIIAGYLSSRVAAGFGRTLRSKVFTHVENFTLHEFDQIGTSSLITRTTNDITQVQQLVNMMLRLMIRAPLTAVGGIIMAFYTDAKLAIVVVVVMPVLGLVIYLVYSRATALFRTMQKKIDTLNRVVRENLTGIRVIRSFNRMDYEQARFDKASFDLTNTATKVNQTMASLTPAMMIVLNFSTIAIIWFGGIRIDHGAMQIGSLMAFIQYVTQILFAIMMVSMMFFVIPRASASAARINQVLQMVPEIQDPVHAKQANEVRGTVEFRHVTFSYPGAEHPAIEDVSFQARPGQVTAIIGGTGAGKSTLVSLIPRFYEVDEGCILVDGVDVREMSQKHLREKIGFVPQRAVLFSGTVAENLRYGNEHATEEEIRHAADVAQATSFVLEMQDGFDSNLDQGGMNVSGGQKQRLSIARSLVRKPEIYVFDDSFSALDFKTEAQLQSALKSEVGDATVVVVAQRVSTVVDADQIIVLDGGRVVGMGSHSALLDSCQVYREIVSSQLAEGETA